MRGLSILFAIIAIACAAAYIWFSSAPADTASETEAAPAPTPAPTTAEAPESAPSPTRSVRSIAPPDATDGAETDMMFGTSAASVETAAEQSDALRRDFRTRPVAYNRPPETMALNRPVDISLVIDATSEADAAGGLDGFEGEIVERDVELSDVVAAQLTGPAFDITPLSVKRQKLSPRVQNRWQWRVTPVETGEHTLILEIFGYTDDDAAAEPLDAYRDRIEIRVRRVDQLISFAQENEPVFGALAAIAGLLSALFGFFRWRLSRAKKTS